jgi:hypothetical protein
MRRETILTMSEAQEMCRISDKIRRALYLGGENTFFLAINELPACALTIRSSWNPLAFVREQEYSEEAGRAIAGAVTITETRDAGMDTQKQLHALNMFAVPGQCLGKTSWHW